MVDDELGPSAAPVEVVLVDSPGCHLCEDAAGILIDAARRHRLQVRRVGLDSAEGRELARRHRAPMPPIVVIDGCLLGWGRLSRGKLAHRLVELASPDGDLGSPRP